jgi:mono/diheme cytochrome c family protein
MLWLHNGLARFESQSTECTMACDVGPAQRFGCYRARVVAALILSLAPAICSAQAAATDGLEQVVKEAQAYRRLYDGWRAVRQLDCARCHGADYHGSVGPSLVDAVKSRTRDDFTRVILEGNVERGMPPYKSVVRVVDNLDGIYEYFRGLAEGKIPAGALPAPE